MSKINVICHMVVTLDGKINGEGMSACKDQPYFSDFYYGIAQTELKARVQMVGRKSTEGFMECVDADQLPVAAPHSVPRTDFYAELPTVPNLDDGERYFAVLDPHGRLALKHNRIMSDIILALKGLRLVLVLVEDYVSDALLTHLRATQVPYVFAGKTKLDVPRIGQRLTAMLGGDTVILHGGARINSTFLAHNCMTQLSLVQIPVVATNPTALPLMAPFPGDQCVTGVFKLRQLKQLEHSGLWLRYDVEEVTPSVAPPPE